VRSTFWDDLADDLRSPRLRRAYRRALADAQGPCVLNLRQRLLLKLMSFLPNVVDVRLREEVSPEEIEAELGVERRLLDRRCRCGKPAAEAAPGCAWHESVSAHYAATLLAVLKAAESAAPGTLVAAARAAADDAELAAQPWFQAGLRDYADDRVRKAQQEGRRS
jgi:hypothetical protein